MAAEPAATARRRFPPDPWLTLSLVVGTFLAAEPAPDGGFAFFVMIGLSALSLRFRLGPWALVALFLIGLELRVLEFGPVGSDVAEVMRTVIDNALAGANPYLPDPVNPDLPPFPYGPIALLWYMPASDPRMAELYVSCLILGLLAVRGRPLGLALWATTPIITKLAIDGANDTGAALFVLAGLVVLERAPRAGALLIGVAAGFKIYALAWLPPIFAWAGAGALAACVVGTVAVWLPAVVAWGPSAILDTFRRADSIHGGPYYSLGHILALANQSASRETLNSLRLVGGALTAIVTFPLVRSHAAVVISGALIYAVTLYAGFWSTAAYVVPLAAVMCWYVDVWLARTFIDPDAAADDASRIRLPGDPIGQLMAWVDERWPPIQGTPLKPPAGRISGP